MFKKFISYYKPHKKLFALDMVCAFIVAICDLFYPMIARNMINEYAYDDTPSRLLIWGAVLLSIYITKAFLNYIIQYWGHIVGVRIQGDMRRDMFRHLQRLPFTFFDEHKTGTILSRIVNDLMDISELAHHGPEDVFLSAIMLIGSFIMLSSINIALTLIIFAIIPFGVLFAIKQRKHMRDAFLESREEIAEVNANIETSISGIRISRSYTAESNEITKFDTANERFKKARGKAYKAMGKFFSGTSFFNDFLYLTGIVSAGLFFFYKKIDAGDFAAYLIYISMFLKPINRIISLFEQLQSGMTGFQRFNEIMIVPPEGNEPDAIELTDVKGNICFENVSFRYTNTDAVDGEDLVISDLSLDIKQGRTIALVGPSGGGKTTLCHLIPRFYELTCGKITIDGNDITKLTRYSLRKSIGIVQQDVFLFNGTIKENIAYGNLDATDEQIIEAAKQANIHDYIMTLSHGYDSQVGERGLKLSGGQKQRISIARVFLKNPPILILDEATSALDNATEMQIQDALSKLAVGRTCLIVAHRLSTIKNADEIIVLTGDGIKERGTHEELLEKGGLYSELYSYQYKSL